MEREDAPLVDWTDRDVPVSRLFDDPYYSFRDGAAEARHVFLAGNDLPERFAPGFRIAELGFGTGLNLLVAWEAWRKSGIAGTLTFTSFEAFPLATEDMRRAHAAWPELGALSGAFLAGFDGSGFRDDSLRFDLVTGDARGTLPAWEGQADAWFLDGFAPARNPELWEADLLREVAAHTAPEGSFATYSAAGEVRRALQAAGFTVTRTPGFGTKRHMTRGRQV